jgi:hypothetical protein
MKREIIPKAPLPIHWKSLNLGVLWAEEERGSDMAEANKN